MNLPAAVQPGLAGRVTDADIYLQSPLEGTERPDLLSGGSLAATMVRSEIRDDKVVIRVKDDAPPWAAPTAQEFSELLRLPQGWDSYGAHAIDPRHVEAAGKVLDLLMQDNTPIPSVVPTNRGGVQLEWHRSGIDIEVETLSPQRFLVSYEDATLSEEYEWEADLASDWTHLSRALARLS